MNRASQSRPAPPACHSAAGQLTGFRSQGPISAGAMTTDPGQKNSQPVEETILSGAVGGTGNVDSNMGQKSLRDPEGLSPTVPLPPPSFNLSNLTQLPPSLDVPAKAAFWAPASTG